MKQIHNLFWENGFVKALNETIEAFNLRYSSSYRKQNHKMKLIDGSFWERFPKKDLDNIDLTIRSYISSSTVNSDIALSDITDTVFERISDEKD